MSFKVTQQFGSGRETVLQHFVKLEEAKQYAQTEAEVKAGMKIDAVFRVYDLYDDVIATYDAKSVVATPKQDTDETADGKGQGAAFRPTPLPTAPRPSGMPANYWVNPDDDKDKSS